MSILSIKFTVSKEVDPERVYDAWRILSDVEAIPRYWRGHREVRVLNRVGNTYMVKIRFAFPGPGNSGIARIEVREEERTVLINYLEGPIRGYVRNHVSNNALVSQWDIEVKPLFLIMKPWIRRHFINGTTNALTRIINELINH